MIPIWLKTFNDVNCPRFWLRKSQKHFFGPGCSMFLPRRWPAFHACLGGAFACDDTSESPDQLPNTLRTHATLPDAQEFSRLGHILDGLLISYGYWYPKILVVDISMGYWSNSRCPLMSIDVLWLQSSHPEFPWFLTGLQRISRWMVATSVVEICGNFHC